MRVDAFSQERAETIEIETLVCKARSKERMETIGKELLIVLSFRKEVRDG